MEGRGARDGPFFSSSKKEEGGCEMITTGSFPKALVGGKKGKKGGKRKKAGNGKSCPIGKIGKTGKKGK